MCLQAPSLAVSRATRLLPGVANSQLIETIISQNTRGLKSDDRVMELFMSLKKRRVFAACLQETWRTGCCTLEHEQCRLVLAGLDPRAVKSRRGEQGVGIALSEKAVAAWKAAGSQVHNDFGARVIAVRLLVKDNRNREVGVFLVSAYAPVGNADQHVWEEFLEKLDQCIARKQRNDVLVVGADTNSSMGVSSRNDENTGIRDSLGKFGLPHVNKAGTRFHTYLEVNSMVALTTCFRKRSHNTWIHPRSKLPHQIDHMLTEKSDFCRITDAGVTQPVIDSDHCAVMCKIRIMARLKRKTSPRQRIIRLDHSRLTDPTVQSEFCEKVVGSFNANTRDADSYTKLAEAMDEAAQTVLPKKRRGQPSWFSADEERLSALVERRNEAMTASFGRRTRSSTMRLRNARKELKSAISKAKNAWIVSKCTAINDASSSRCGTKECWDVLGELRKGLSKSRPSSEKMMEKGDGSKCQTSEENAEVFRSHFETMYGRDPTYDPTVLDLLPQQPTAPECDHVPTDEEIMKAVRKLKNKAPGDSGLCPQLWKALVNDPRTYDLLKTIIVDFWLNELPPEQWQKGLLKILPKKGDLSKPGNYRGIMLLEAAYKVVAILLHERLQPIAEGLDHEAQCGFRPGRGCADAVFTIKLAMKKRREHGQETWILFLDLVKAFDRVPRELLWEILMRFGVPPKLIELLKALHKDIEVKFEVDDVSHTINCIIGVKQGDILGPVLFTIFMAAVMITWRVAYNRPLCIYRTKKDFVMTGRRPRTKGSEFAVGDSEYADDAAVLFATRESLEECIPVLLKHFERFGMEVHTGHADQPDKPPKTEILFVAAPNSVYNDPESFDNQDLGNVELGGDRFLPIVNQFCYLGTTLTTNCNDAADVKARIKAAGNAFGALRKCIFSNSSISFSAKSIVYDGLILSILLYGSECWCLTEQLLHLLRLFHARCVRAMCRVNRWHVRKHRITTAELLNRVGLLPIDVYVTRRQLRWAGHVARMSFERLPRKMLSAWVPEKRPVGAPEFTYGRGLVKSLKKASIDKNSWHTLAQDRVLWGEAVASMN